MSVTERFLIFFAVEIVVYGGLNLILFLKFRQAFPALRSLHAPVAAFLVVMAFGLPIVLSLDRWGPFWAARAIAIVAYSWMPVVMWMGCLLLAAGVWNLVVRALSGRLAAFQKFTLLPCGTFIASCVIVLVAVIWSLYAAQRARVVRVTLRSPHVASQKPMKVMQISDMHLGLILRTRTLNRVLDIYRDEKPDLLLSTGDLVDASSHSLDRLAEVLAEAKPPLGKYAVLGNHDYFAGLENSLTFHQAAGFTVLRGEAREIPGTGITLAGVDDPAGLMMGMECHPDVAEALKGREHVTILMKHRPTVHPESVGHFDLQLSGHTHGGQLFPFSLIVDAVWRVLPGWHDLGQGSALYLSRGTGTWGPPMRLFEPPEVAIITIVPAEGTPSHH